MYRPFRRPCRPRKFSTTARTTPAGIHRTIEPLESRQLLSASAALVEPVQPLTAEYDYPVIDLNGDAPGVDYASTYIASGPRVALGDLDNLSVHAATPYLQSVRFFTEPATELYELFYGPSSFGGAIDIQVDTSGTNITAFTGGAFLSGLDTLANYEKVLKTVRFRATDSQAGASGLTVPLALIATDSNGVAGPSSHHLVTVVAEPPPALDLNGPSAGNDYAAAYSIGAPPVSIVDAGLSIQTNQQFPLLAGARIEIVAGAGTLHVDTTGTAIQATYGENFVLLTGTTLATRYEQVLRTTTFTTTESGPGGRVSVVFTVEVEVAGTPAHSISVPVVSRIAVQGIPQTVGALPVVDLNGPLQPGTGRNETLYQGLHQIITLNQPLFRDPFLTIDSTSGNLTGAAIAFDSPPGQLFVNTMGTAIAANWSGNTLLLSGTDTTAHYAQVLSSVTFSRVDLTRGGTHRVLFSVTNANGTSLPATALITVLAPPPKTIDLDSDADRDYYTASYRVGDPAIPIVDDDATISPAFLDLVGGFEAHVEGGGGTLHVDTSGTNTTTIFSGEFLYVRGVDTRANYEKILRSLTFESSEPGEGVRRVWIFLHDESEQRTPRAEVLIAVEDPPIDMGYDYPVIDLNGDEPGIDYTSVEYYTGTFPPNGMSLGSGDIQVHSSTGYLQSVHFGIQATELWKLGGTLPTLYLSPPDTSGTNIEFLWEEDLVLSGLDTVENYEIVLERIMFELGTSRGQAHPIYVYAVDAQGIRGPQSQHLITAIAPPPPVIDLPLPGSGPVVDTNGAEAGTSAALTIYHHYGAADIPLFNSPITIHSPVPVTLTGARIEFDSDPGEVVVDTSGTGILSSRDGNALLLSGAGSLEEYAQVLGSLVFVDLEWGTGTTHQVQFTVEGPSGMSPPSTALVTVLQTPGVLLDVNGDPNLDYFATTYHIGGPPVSIVDAAGLTLESPDFDTIYRVDVYLRGGPGTLSVDTTGTNIRAEGGPAAFSLLGRDTLANYEKVLRTLTFQTSVVGDGTRRVEIQLLDDSIQNVPLGESLIMIEGSPPATVLGRHIFYNNSKFDGLTPGASVNDDSAIAADKSPYFAGAGLATSAAVTSYVHGINGIMIDVAGLAGSITADDFTFKIGSSNSPDTWSVAPPPSQIVVRPGAGEGGSDRIVLIWPDGAIKNTWLQLTLEGNDAAGGFNTNTGLAASDVFYFGNRVGDSFFASPPATFTTSAADAIGARGNIGFDLPVTTLYDFNRDGLVSAADEIIARNNPGFLVRLNLPSPGVKPAAAASDELDQRALPDQNASALASALAVRQVARAEVLGDRKVSSAPPPVATPSVVEAVSADGARWKAVESTFSAVDELLAVDDDLLGELLSNR